MNEEMLSMGRYKEKQTGKYWECTGMHTANDTRYYHIWPVENSKHELQLTREDIEARFDYMPYPKPVIKTESVIQRHPILISLQCPECGSVLKVKGGAILTSPLQYEHICSNKDCHYHVCLSSIHSGMYALVTDEQERSINEGTYSERKCGRVIEITEKEASLLLCK